MRSIIIFLTLVPVLAYAQVGGGNGYQLLDLPFNPRTAALGGTTISLADGDISQFFENPATLDSVAAGDIFFNINPYFADAFVFSGAYNLEMKNAGSFTLGLNYMGYGNFDRTDAAGNAIGTFNAQEYIATVGKAHQLGPITLGVNLKLLHSSIDSYGSTALLGDIGGLFRPTKSWTIAMVFRNIGGRITNFTSVTDDIPFNVKIGTTFKPEYMPLRFTITSNNLTDSNVVEENNTEGRSNVELEKILRRINLGAELILSDGFQLLLGYSHKRKQELKLDELGGGAGFSYGMMVKIKRLQLRYSRATFHASGGTSFISIQTNLNEFRSIL